MNQISSSSLKVSYSGSFKKASQKLKKKDSNLYNRMIKQVEKTIKEPNLGKPLRYSLKNCRRLHIGSFVLVYEFHNHELRFLDFDHHDRIYK